MDFWTIFWIIIGIAVLVFFLLTLQFVGLYVRAIVSGSHVGFVDLMGMRVRKVNPLAIVNSRIQAMRAGLNISTAEMESHFLAGGDVQRVIRAM
ncbi:MAG: hypothetical protein JWN51_2238, partial [Phycisphaerales bacterium]|nr:hypothetical protein [Phycisphaerales bacterium]